jgi:hypothetical protein
VIESPPAFEYQLRPLPPGRFGFRRWRYELWHGALLVATGWRTAPGDAERALRAAASRRAHQLAGLHVLHPDSAQALDRFFPGAVVRLDCGALTCILAPRGLADAAAA